MSSTLSLGSAGYELLDTLDQLKPLSKSGSAFQLKAEVVGTTVDDLGIDLTNAGASNLNIFANVSDFQAALGDKSDTLNIFGDITGSTIELDDSLSLEKYNDILNIQGSLTSKAETNNEIYAGDGNDTIRIAGSAEDTDIYLSFGNDSLVISGSANNLNVNGYDDDGNDYIEFRGTTTDTRVNSGAGNDTVIFSKGLDGIVSDVHLGSGNDSLVLGKGSYVNATFNTGSGTDTISLGSAGFTSVDFQLDGSDKLTSAANSSFTSSQFASESSLGDTLVFGSGTIFDGTDFYLGQGADSLVFGSNSTYFNSTITTGDGSDTIVFGANSTFLNSTIDLGFDNDIDVVRFAANTNTDIRITNAGEGDVLVVGASYYSYSAASNSWLDTANSSYNHPG